MYLNYFTKSRELINPLILSLPSNVTWTSDITTTLLTIPVFSRYPSCTPRLSANDLSEFTFLKNYFIQHSVISSSNINIYRYICYLFITCDASSCRSWRYQAPSTLRPRAQEHMYQNPYSQSWFLIVIQTLLTHLSMKSCLLLSPTNTGCSLYSKNIFNTIWMFFLDCFFRIIYVSLSLSLSLSTLSIFLSVSSSWTWYFLESFKWFLFDRSRIPEITILLKSRQIWHQIHIFFASWQVTIRTILRSGLTRNPSWSLFEIQKYCPLKYQLW